MGFWDKVRTAVLGTRSERTPPIATEPQERPRIDMMEYKSFDLGQRFEQLFTAIKLHDERMVKFMDEGNHEVLDRLDMIIGMLKEPKTVQLAEQKLIELKENIIFTPKLDQIIELIKKEGTITPSKLADLLGVTPEAAHGFLTRLVKLDFVEKVFHGTYKLKTINKETLNETDSTETQAQNDSANTAQPV